MEGSAHCWLTILRSKTTYVLSKRKLTRLWARRHGQARGGADEVPCVQGFGGEALCLSSENGQPVFIRPYTTVYGMCAGEAEKRRRCGGPGLPGLGRAGLNWARLGCVWLGVYWQIARCR